MNDLLLIHQERLRDKQSIIQGAKLMKHDNPMNYYFQRQRQRQKKQNSIINNLKKGNKNFNGDELKRNFIFSTIQIMNSFLQKRDKIANPYKKSKQTCPTTQQTDQSQNSEKEVPKFLLKQLELINKEPSSEQLNIIKDNSFQISHQQNPHKIQRQFSNKHYQRYPNQKTKLQKQFNLKEQEKQETQQNRSQKISENNNFYQTYINLFVNFFNRNFDTVNLNSIKSIIRPNNRFVLVDLLKALLQFARNNIKVLLKQTTFYINSSKDLEKIKILRTNTESNLDFNQKQDIQIIEKGQDDEDQKIQIRRIHTEPEINSPRNSIKQIKNQIQKISPLKPFRTKNTSSSTQFMKSHSTQTNKLKSQQGEELNSRYLQAHFIQFNIKQAIYQKNLQFANQINLQKLEAKVNNIYIELQRLNYGNAEIINKFYEQTFGKKNKFNYDSRGLYSQTQISTRKSQLIQQIRSFQLKSKPTSLSNTVQLVQYSQEYTRYKNKEEQLAQLKQKQKKYSKSIWLPISIQFTASIVLPLKLQIEETNLLTGEIHSYHWKKYKKQYSICEYFKQRLKLQYQKAQNKQAKMDKNIERESFKKQKFRKSNFLDNRKKINDLLQSNNIITTKKESIFPVLKGIQQNFLKNNNMGINYSNGYSLQNNFSKSRAQTDHRLKSHLSNSISTSKASFNNQNSSERQKRFDSIKKTLEVRQKLERKQSQSQKMLQKINDMERTQVISKLSLKYDIIQRANTRKISQKHEKKSLISISRVMEMRGDLIYKESSNIVKSIENTNQNPNKKIMSVNIL